jgi:hypothetical protein
VYALAALLQALLILALLRWRQGRSPLWGAGLLLGLGLAHHRTIILMIPGALLYYVLSDRKSVKGITYPVARQAGGLEGLRPSKRPSFSSGSAGSAGTTTRKMNILGRRSLPKPLHHVSPANRILPESSRNSVAIQELAAALGAALAGCLLYLYLPLRAPQWIDSPQAFVQYVAGSSALSVWLTPEQPWLVAWEHVRELAQHLIWPQFFPLGALLALLGALRLWWRDRAAAALLTFGYALVLLFCTLFFVQDVDVFMISAHLIAALLLGEGAMLLVERTKDEGRTTNVAKPWAFVLRLPSLVGLALLLLPALLLLNNLAPIRAANSGANEAITRATLAQPLPAGALLIVDWEAVEAMRYLQALEGLRPDLEIRPLNADVARADAEAALAAGRAVYLLRPQPELGLAQSPAGRLWRISTAPIALRADTPIDQRWQDGITLRGFSLPRGPYQPGDVVPITLEWHAQAAPAQRYTLFAHIVGEDGIVRGQQDREPSRAPTDKWQPNDRLIDVYGPALSLETPPGRYQIIIGWYSYPSLARLPLASTTADSYTLGEIEVVAP